MSNDNEIISDENMDGQYAQPLRAIVFGTQPLQVKQMSNQLIRKKILSRGIVDEKLLLSALSEVDPDLIFLEINGQTRSPIEKIVKIVSLWTTNYARKVNAVLNSPSPRLWAKAKVIMFKSEIDYTGINPHDITITDEDETLFRCKEVGDVIYIGLYSAWSFYSKIEPFLRK
jgi:hypothetical protein